MGLNGKEGEAVAASYLMKQGYRLVERNFRCAYGEIDLIAWENETLVFVEVKTRSSTQFGGPEGAMNARKQEKISRVAAAYLQKKKLEGSPCRFDVVCIVRDARGTTIALFRNAFERTPSPILL